MTNKKIKDKILIRDILIENLSEKHVKLFDNFYSFEKELVDFLKEDALDNQEKKISRTHLWFHKPTKKLIGYVTLLTDKISLHTALKEKFREEGINYRSLPALKIGRLCIQDEFLRKGVGTHMVDWTIYLIQKINEFAGCRFITLDAKRYADKKKDPIHFYKENGFYIYKQREKGTTPMYKDVYKLINK